jgi:hypothetical protein
LIAAGPRLRDNLCTAYDYPTEGFRLKSWDEFAEIGAPKMDFVFTVSAARRAKPFRLGEAADDRSLEYGRPWGCRGLGFGKAKGLHLTWR